MLKSYLRKMLNSMKITLVLTWCMVLTAGVGAAHADPVSTALRAAVKNGVPQDQASAVVSRARTAGIGDKDISEMLQVLVRARQDNVPVGAVSGKIMEGISKHVPPAMIVTTAGRLEQAYLAADSMYRGMNGTGPGGDELKQAMAIAVFNGITKEELTDLYRAAPHAGQAYYAMGTVSLTSLVASGFGTKESLSFMKKAFAEHQSTGDIQRNTMKMMEQGMAHGSDMHMNRGMMPGGPQDGMSGSQNMHMQNNMNMHVPGR